MTIRKSQDMAKRSELARSDYRCSLKTGKLGWGPREPPVSSSEQHRTGRASAIRRLLPCGAGRVEDLEIVQVNLDITVDAECVEAVLSRRHGQRRARSRAETKANAKEAEVGKIYDDQRDPVFVAVLGGLELTGLAPRRPFGDETCSECCDRVRRPPSSLTVAPRRTS